MNYNPGQPTAAEPTTRGSLWHRGRPGADRHTSLMFWLSVLGVASIALLTVTWGASSILAQKGPEKLLRLGLHFPKLKSIQWDRKADASRTSEPHPSAQAQPKDRTTPPPPPAHDPRKAPVVAPVETPEPPQLHLIRQLELAPPPVETCDDPAVYLHPCTPQRGDSPMIRNWKTLTMFSLLSAAAISLAPPPAVVAAEEKKSGPSKEDELKKSLEELTRRIAALEAKKLTDTDKDAIADILRRELKSFEDGPLAKLNKNLDALQIEQKNHQLRLEQHKFLIDQLAKRLDTPTTDKAVLDTLRAIQDGIAKLGPTEKRTMAYSGNGTSATVGRIVLVNNYSDELLFIINGAGHRVPAFSSKLVEGVPPGSIAVEVFSTRFSTFFRQATTLAAGETFTLTANPSR